MDAPGYCLARTPTRLGPAALPGGPQVFAMMGWFVLVGWEDVLCGFSGNGSVDAVLQWMMQVFALLLFRGGGRFPGEDVGGALATSLRSAWVVPGLRPCTTRQALARRTMSGCRSLLFEWRRELWMGGLLRLGWWA
jgi:hypothetical protein